MPALDGRVDYVVGVDTHRGSHTAAVVDLSGGVLSSLTVPSDAFGAKRILKFAEENGPGRRVWATEGTGSFGAGLATFLLERNEWVVEVDRPRRLPARNGAKSDDLDAVRAAREALSREHLTQPRRGGEREAIRVLLATRRGAIEARTQAIALLKATIVSAPEGLRLHFRSMTTDEQLTRAARLRTNTAQSAEHRATICALRSTARCALALEARPPTSSRSSNSWSPSRLPACLLNLASASLAQHRYSMPGRIREGWAPGAFAALAGVAPIPASSGQVVRYRLSRSGDRQLNRALHTVVLSRLAHDQETKTYAERRAAEGKTPREIKRCLKRHLARRIFRLLEASVTT